MSLRIGIVGCGVMGSRRAATAAACGDHVALAADIAPERAEALAERHGARRMANWEELVASPQVDAIVVATVNSATAEVALGALAAGKHVLCEKPFGTTAEEAGRLLDAAIEAETVVKVGFTLRHHEGISRARALVEAGEIGTPVGMRAAYGHGGRPGYENEWRGSSALAGGGELLDQGVHLLDLARWFLGEFTEVTGAVATWSWSVEPLEDNAFMLLRTDSGCVASLHTSWTQWRNLFRLELLGSEGLLSVEGLGGSYGPEEVVCARRRPGGGIPDQRQWTIRQPESAWNAEWKDFATAIHEGRPALTSAHDGYSAARLVDAIYASARDGTTVRLMEVTAQ